jgi:RNA polymerase-binding transcription factor DksA
MTGTENESVAAIESVLNAVDHALERLRLGTYRSCQVCGAPISEDALEADPVLAHCPAHPELS